MNPSQRFQPGQLGPVHIPTANRPSRAQAALQRIQSAEPGETDAQVIAAFVGRGLPIADLKPRVNILTFKAWLALGRCVRKGEHGVRLGRVSVFHLSQTDPLPAKSNAATTPAPAVDPTPAPAPDLKRLAEILLRGGILPNVTPAPEAASIPPAADPATDPAPATEPEPMDATPVTPPAASEPEVTHHSWKVEVLVENKWSTNGMRYATEREAAEAGRELLSRWWVPKESRAAESTDPVNARFDFDRYKSELLPEPSPVTAPEPEPVVVQEPVTPPMPGWKAALLRQMQATA